MHVLSDANGLPLLVGVPAGNTNDSEELKPMIEGHQTKRDTALIAVGTSRPGASTQIKPTLAPTCADGSGGSESEYASPPKASNPASD